jgi:hypothetical protein
MAATQMITLYFFSRGTILVSIKELKNVFSLSVFNSIDRCLNDCYFTASSAAGSSDFTGATLQISEKDFNLRFATTTSDELASSVLTKSGDSFSSFINWAIVSLSSATPESFNESGVWTKELSHMRLGGISTAISSMIRTEIWDPFFSFFIVASLVSSFALSFFSFSISLIVD